MGMNKITIYADGACRGNQFKENIGAWAYKLMFKNKIKIDSNAFRNTTNNIMELTAVINALKALKPASSYYPIEIYTDSQYVVNGITTWINGWLRRDWKDVKNVDLWQELWELKNKFSNINFYHVKGHSTDLNNVEVDKLCNIAMNKFLKEIR